MTTEPSTGRLDLSRTHKEIFSGHLRLGGVNSLGERIGGTNYYDAQGQARNTSTAMANRMEFTGEEILRLHSFAVIPEYALRLS